MIFVKITKDRHVTNEFAIDSRLESHLKSVLEAMTKCNTATLDKNDTSLDDTNECDNGVQDCCHDDYDMMSDGCKEVRGADIADSRDDTFD